MAKKGKKKSNYKYFITVLVVVVALAVLAGLYYTDIIKFKLPAGDAAAKVNGEKITKTELDRQYELFFTLTGYPDAVRNQVTKEAYLNQMIVEELMIQEAEKAGISILSVSEADIKQSLDDYLTANGITSKQLVENLVAKELTIEELQDYFKKQVTINKFLEESLLADLTVTDQELQGFYEQNKASFEAQEGQIRARHILIETKEEAEDIIKELRGGKDFAELAMEKSIDTGSGQRGGELGFFTKEMMVEDFSDAAFDLTVNKVSRPVETQFGWHVIQRQSDTLSYDDVKDILAAQLSQEKQRVTLQTYINQLRTNADIKNFMEDSDEETTE